MTRKMTTDPGINRRRTKELLWEWLFTVAMTLVCWALGGWSLALAAFVVNGLLASLDTLALLKHKDR